MNYLICALVGYLVGTINPSYFISKLKGFDIRERGSGNAGASNALILFGKLTGILCAFFDIFKAVGVILLTAHLFPDFEHSFIVTGIACIMGHIFPFYMKFRGGKGLACLGGMILAFKWWVFLIMLAFELVLVLVLKYICFVPITASFIFVGVYGAMKKDLFGAFLMLLASFVILFKHRKNLDRIKKGTEARFSMLWNRDKEIERLKKNIDANTEDTEETEDQSESQSL